MAINDDNKTGSNMGDAFAKAGITGKPSDAAPAASETTDTRRPRRSSSLDNVTAAGINNHFRRSFARAPTSQAVIEFAKAFQKSLDENSQTEADSPVQYFIKSVDSSDSQDVAIACILVCAAFEAAGKKQMIVFTLLVEGSVAQMPMTEIAIPGLNKPVELQMTAGDYAVESLWAAITAKLTSVFGGDYNFVPAGDFTLPRTIDPVKDVAEIRECLFYATGALDTYIERTFDIGSEPLTIQVITNKATTAIVMDLNDRPGITATGMPLRNDVAMTLRSTVRSTATGVPDKVINVVRLQGFIDLAFTNPPARNDANMRQDTRRFTPRFVLTDLASETNLITLETQLLALSLAPLLDNNDQYLAPLMPAATQRNKFRDFGAVGFEVNLSGEDGARPVGKEDLSKMSTAEIFTMARMSLFPDLHVALLVDEAGPVTWMNSAFVNAAMTNGGDAYEAIFDAANNLTGKLFESFFPAGTPISVLTNTRMHMGYYYDENGEIRDLLDIDYLWFLNYAGAKNIEMVYDFADTFLGNDDPNKQLADRWAIITKAVPSATLVSYGQIVELTPEFLTALIQSVKQAGLQLRAQNSLVDFNNARGRASFAGGGGLNSQQIGGILNQGNVGDNRRGSGYQQGAGLGMNSWNRR
jgi:hypothetical protein